MPSPKSATIKLNNWLDVEKYIMKILKSKILKKLEKLTINFVEIAYIKWKV